MVLKKINTDLCILHILCLIYCLNDSSYFVLWNKKGVGGGGAGSADLLNEPSGLGLDTPHHTNPVTSH